MQAGSLRYLMNDLRYAFRQLIKSPGFTLVAVITLALGIGANSAIFSVIDAVLLRSLPFPNPDRLTMVWATAPQHPGEDKQVHSYPDFLDLRAQNHTFAALAAYFDGAPRFGARAQMPRMSPASLPPPTFLMCSACGHCSVAVFRPRTRNRARPAWS